MNSNDESEQSHDEMASANDATDERAGNSLADAARDEQSYARERLREELKREPTEDEINEWLREHTEGY